MANTIQTTELANHIPTIVAAEALGYLRANTVMANLVARDWDDEVAQAGQVVKIPFRGALTANNKAEGSIVTKQTPSDTAVTVTLNKHKEVTFIIEDVAKAFARPEVLMGYMRDGMAVIAEAVDGDLTGLYSGLSQTIDASGGAGPLDLADFREAQRLLNAAKAPMGDRVAVLHEDAYFEATNIAQLIHRDYQGDEAMTAIKAGYLGSLSGFRIFMDQKIAVATAVCKNLFFNRNAFVLASRPLPSAPVEWGVAQAVMAEDGLGLRVTMSYDTDYLGAKCTIDFLYGVAELRDAFGVTVSTTEK